MTEKNQSEKKPVWEPMDEKETEAGRRKFIEEIGAAKSRQQEYWFRQNALPIGQEAPSLKAHFATLYLMQSHYIEILDTIYNFAEGFVEMNKRLAVVLQSLDKQIQEISEKTGTDLSQIKSEMAQVKETVNAPIYKYLKEQKKGEEKIRKSGEATFDHLTRSH